MPGLGVDIAQTLPGPQDAQEVTDAAIEDALEDTSVDRRAKAEQELKNVAEETLAKVAEGDLAGICMLAPIQCWAEDMWVSVMGTITLGIVNQYDHPINWLLAMQKRQRERRMDRGEPFYPLTCAEFKAYCDALSVDQAAEPEDDPTAAPARFFGPPWRKTSQAAGVSSVVPPEVQAAKQRKSRNAAIAAAVFPLVSALIRGVL